MLFDVNHSNILFDPLPRMRFFFFSFFFLFLRLHLQCMEVLRLEIISKLQLLAYPQPQQGGIGAVSVIYTTAPGNARSLTLRMRQGIEPTSSWILVGFPAEPQWEIQQVFVNQLFYRVVCVQYSHPPNPLRGFPYGNYKIDFKSESFFLFYK